MNCLFSGLREEVAVRDGARARGAGAGGPRAHVARPRRRRAVPKGAGGPGRALRFHLRGSFFAVSKPILEPDKKVC